MPKNSLAFKMKAEIEAAKEQWLNIGVDFGVQMFTDYLAIVLNNPAVMGKDTLGADRIKKVLEGLKDAGHVFGGAFDPTRDDEADYLQEKMDEALRRIYRMPKGAEGDPFIPFEQRYPCLKQVTYKRRKP